MMEAARTSETLVYFYQTTRRYNPEDGLLRTHRRENLILLFTLCFPFEIKSVWWCKVYQCSRQNTAVFRLSKKVLKMCTLWSTLKYQRCSLLNTTGHDVSRANTGITNATLVSKSAVVFKAICDNSIQGHCCNNVLQSPCKNVTKDAKTDRQTWADP
jgi:hypothetical protein